MPSPFSPPLNGLTITAYNAGHTLGGTIWHLQQGLESVVYAVDWNQVRENVLSGAAWLGGSAGGAEVIEQLRKPTALVCSSKGAERNPLAGGRKRRDEMLLDMIRATVAKGGIVLIPTDTSARVLELAYLLEHAWRKEASNGSSDSPLKNTKLYLASRNVGATMRYARSMLEWMDENVIREFETDASGAANRQYKRTDSKQASNREKHDRSNQPSGAPCAPFDFNYLKLLERRSQIEKITSNKAARVILASDSSLEWGFSREILQRIAADPSNLIILTEEYGLVADNDGHHGLGRTLWEWFQERRDGVAMETGSDGQNLEQVHTGGKELLFRNAERVSLEGKELAIYQQYLATQRRLQDTLQAASGANLETSADALEENSSSSSSSSEESDPERQGKALNTSAAVAHLNRNKMGLNKETLGVNILLRQPGVYDYDVRGKKGREQMFPFVSKRRRGDDFGDLIRPEDYLRAEERDEVVGQDMRDNGPGKQAGLGQKRKWEDSGLQNGVGRQGSNGPNKRRQGPAGNAEPPMNMTNGNANGNHNTEDEEDEIPEDSDTEPEDVVVGPSKVTYNSSSVQANLRIAYVDFAGLHDQRSLSMLIPLIQPRKLILVGGTTSETTYLADDCRQKLNPHSIELTNSSANTVFTPLIGETVNASVDTNAWTVKLSEALVRRLNWQSVRDLGVVTLMGLLTATTVNGQPQEEAVSKKRLKLLKQDLEEFKAVEVPASSEPIPEVAPLLDVLPTSMAAATRSVAQPLHVGDLRLADLRKLLQAGGHTAEFRGEGTLLIDGLVAVRKSGTGKIEVESGGIQMPDYRTRKLEGPFYAVKRKIYEGLAVIAGG